MDATRRDRQPADGGSVPAGRLACPPGRPTFPTSAAAFTSAAAARESDMRGKVLITGGAGFTGLHVADALLRRAHAKPAEWTPGQRSASPMEHGPPGQGTTTHRVPVVP